MLNSVARYLWGSSSEAGEDGGDQTSGQPGTDQTSSSVAAAPDHGVATQQAEDGDWILVGLEGQGDSLDSATTTAAWCSALSGTTTSLTSATSDLSRVTPSRPPCSRVSARAGGLVHTEAATPQQLVRIERAAQQLQRCTEQKVVSGQRCERQNKVRDYQSHPKVKTNNRRNKHMHASGAKSSRFSQRM